MLSLETGAESFVLVNHELEHRAKKFAMVISLFYIINDTHRENNLLRIC